MSRARTQLTDDLAEFLQVKRTRQEITAKFGATDVVRSTLGNMVARGEVANLSIGQGRSTPGVYIVVRKPPGPIRRAAAAPGQGAPLTLGFGVGLDLQRVWMGARA